MPDNDRSILSYDLDLPDVDPDSGILSLPASVQRKMDRGAEHLRDGEVREALALTHDAGLELAKTEPLVFAGLMAAQMGVTGMRAYRRGGNRKTVDSERFAFGVRTGHSRETTTEEFFEERGVDFGPDRGFGGGRREW